jgi:hypothetical protein
MQQEELYEGWCWCGCGAVLQDKAALFLKQKDNFWNSAYKMSASAIPGVSCLQWFIQTSNVNFNSPKKDVFVRPMDSNFLTFKCLICWGSRDAPLEWWCWQWDSSISTFFRVGRSWEHCSWWPSCKWESASLSDGYLHCFSMSIEKSLLVAWKDVQIGFKHLTDINCVWNRGFTDEFCVQADTFGCTFMGANYGLGCKNKRYK